MRKGKKHVANPILESQTEAKGSYSLSTQMKILCSLPPALSYFQFSLFMQDPKNDSNTRYAHSPFSLSHINTRPMLIILIYLVCYIFLANYINVPVKNVNIYKLGHHNKFFEMYCYSGENAHVIPLRPKSIIYLTLLPG